NKALSLLYCRASAASRLWGVLPAPTISCFGRTAMKVSGQTLGVYPNTVHHVMQIILHSAEAKSHGKAIWRRVKGVNAHLAVLIMVGQCCRQTKNIAGSMSAKRAHGSTRAFTLTYWRSLR